LRSSIGDELQDRDENSDGFVTERVPNIHVTGQHLQDETGAVGYTYLVNEYSDDYAEIKVWNGRVPAIWYFAEHTGFARDSTQAEV